MNKCPLLKIYICSPKLNTLQMRNILTFLFLFLVSYNLSSQTFSINGTIAGHNESNVYLMRILGEKQKVVDTALSSPEGSFEFKLNKDFPIGMYAITGGPKQIVEIIYNKENIRFVSSGKDVGDNIQVIESVENLIWYDYLYLKALNKYKMEVIENILFNYPPDDEYFKISQTKYQQLQDLISNRALELLENNPGTFASHLIKVDKPVFAPSELKDADRQKYLINHHFDNTDFTDTLVLRSNILTAKIVRYLSLYQRPGLTQKQLEDRLIMAVDTVLEKAIVDQQVYEAVVGFLIKGFETIGFERGLEHIAEQNQLDELCVNSERKAELENKLELIKKLAIGKIAPDFSVSDISGENITLSEIKSEKTILVFWASWCPHCIEIMPVLQEFYNSSTRDELEIIAISVDDNKDNFLNAITSHGLVWRNIAKLEGWEGPTVEEYGVVATPTIFILDKDKKILSKPTNKVKLRKELEGEL